MKTLLNIFKPEMNFQHGLVDKLNEKSFSYSNLILIECVVCASSSADVVWKSDGIGFCVYIYNIYDIWFCIYIYMLKRWGQTSTVPLRRFKPCFAIKIFCKSLATGNTPLTRPKIRKSEIFLDFFQVPVRPFSIQPPTEPWRFGPWIMQRKRRRNLSSAGLVNTNSSTLDQLWWALSFGGQRLIYLYSLYVH